MADPLTTSEYTALDKLVQRRVRETRKKLEKHDGKRENFMAQGLGEKFTNLRRTMAAHIRSDQELSDKLCDLRRQAHRDASERRRRAA